MDRPTVLIVDDKPKLLDSLSMILETDFNVLTALNGMDGISSFQNNPAISIILLDIDMPVMNGIEALERIREISSDVKVVIMTGKSCHDYAKKCANLNVQRYMEKPFKAEKLIELMKKVIGIKDHKILKDILKDGYDTRSVSISQIVKGALHYIDINFHTEFNVKHISDHLDVTHEYLSRKFHKECGIQLVEYINRYKIEKSQEYIALSPQRTIGKVASSVGVNNINYFSRIFKKHTGMTPSQFRETISNSQEFRKNY